MIQRAMKDTEDGVKVRNALRQRGFTLKEIAERVQMLEDCFNFT
jgi:SOS response regulatory protein OraA/RecX